MLVTQNTFCYITKPLKQATKILDNFPKKTLIFSLLHAHYCLKETINFLQTKLWNYQQSKAYMQAFKLVYKKLLSTKFLVYTETKTEITNNFSVRKKTLRKKLFYNFAKKLKENKNYALWYHFNRKIAAIAKKSLKICMI